MAGTLARSLAALVVLVTGGCSFALDTALVLENRCASDRDCTASSCNMTTRMCVSAPQQTYRFGVSVLAAGADPSSLETYTLGTFDLESTSQLELALPETVLVGGLVTWRGEPVATDVSFADAPAFPGAPTQRYTSRAVDSSLRAADGQPAGYQLEVVAGSTYDLVLTPTGDAVGQLPPLVRSVTVPDVTDFVRFDIAYPEELREVRGTVRGREGRDADTRMNGLQVRAIDTQTGRTVSSTAISGEHGEPGEFRLVLDPDVTSYRLRVSPSADRPVFPTFTVDPDYIFPDPDGQLHVLVPEVRRVRYVGFVEGCAGAARCDEGSLVRLPDATLTLRSTSYFDDATGVTGSYQTTVRTDETGKFETDVLPGTYEVVVTAGGRHHGVLVESVRFGSAPDSSDVVMGQVFVLPPRARFNGQLATMDGRPVEGAIVQARPTGLAPVALGVAARHNRSMDTVTAADGTFELMLDQGSYDFLFMPPEEAGFPWFVLPGQQVGASNMDVGRFEFPAPVAVEGTLRGADGTGLAGISMDAHALLTDPDGTARAVELGRAVTRPDGSYTLLLPPRL